MGVIFKAHPWHGVNIGDQSPQVITSYIELVPSDSVKYEIDKYTGILKVDRPQKFSNVCPSLYGLIPQTFCAEKVAEMCMEKTGRTGIIGDQDPLDICVLSSKTIAHGDVLLQAIPIGGMRMIDEGEADDKIIAILQGDGVYGNWKDIADCSEQLVASLKHYFLTYKDVPGEDDKRTCEITHIYGVEEAHEVIRRSQDDYQSRFGELKNMLTAALRG
ncbi:MAG: inorganic pyrophosphatase [Methylococcales bacterium]|nr:inorganic pyrophosphatase [Methylococcales bacterium]